MTFAQVKELYASLFAQAYADPDKPGFTASEFQLLMQRARDGEKQHNMAVIAFAGRGVQVNIAIVWLLTDDREMVERKFFHANDNLRAAIVGHFEQLHANLAKFAAENPVQGAAIEAAQDEGRLHQDPGQA